MGGYKVTGTVNKPWVRKPEPAISRVLSKDNHSSGTAVTDCLKQPTGSPLGTGGGQHKAALLPYLVLLRAGFTVPRTVTSRAVRSYRTFSPLPAQAGGLFSVALSIGSRLPGVTWRPVRRSPDFPLQPELQRLPGRLRLSRPRFYQHPPLFSSSSRSYNAFFFKPVRFDEIRAASFAGR